MWTASYVMLWLVVVVLVVVVIALLRQIGVLHARLAPRGVHFGGEGPELNQQAPLAGPFGYTHKVTLVAFTKVGCEICEMLKPALVAVREQYHDMRFVEINHDLGPDAPAVFQAFNVRSTPYFVAVDADGIVRGRGVGNTLEQIEELIEEAIRTGSRTMNASDGSQIMMGATHGQ